MYVPVAQFGTQDMTLLVRTATAHPEALTSAITAKVREIDPELPVTDIKTLDQYRTDSVAVPRFNTFLLSLFAALALTLTAIGLYGVISYSVTQRTNEIGIRMALGAGTADILKMILQQGMKLVIIGLGIGLVLAFAVTRMIGSLLHNVSVYDPFTFAAVAFILLGIALFACFIPARRATKTDPLVSLKYE
jgi:putative ABC transport system permease protein